MGERADALAYKADVPSRTKDRISGMKDTVMSRVGGSSPDGDQAKDQARKAKRLAENNPLGLAVGAAAVGFLAGLLVPGSRLEDEKLGPMADDLKDRAKDLGQEAAERSKDVASDAAQAASESAQDKGREEGARLQESAAHHAEQTRQQTPG